MYDLCGSKWIVSSRSILCVCVRACVCVAFLLPCLVPL